MVQPRYVLALDQGTTSTRAIVFTRDGQVYADAQKEHRQIFPRAGWVEHDPVEIRDNAREVLGQALGKGNLTGADLAALTEVIELGGIRPALERTFPLAQAPAAIDHVSGGHARGKVVVTVGRPQQSGAQAVAGAAVSAPSSATGSDSSR